MPAGGLQELREKHRAGWVYFDALVHLAQAGEKLSKTELAYGLRYVVASLWVVADNARPMAIEKLKLTGKLLVLMLIACNLVTMYVIYACLELKDLKGGVVMSTHFKTSAVYGYQPVTLPLLLDIYVKYFRHGSDEVEEVFLTTTGAPMKQGYINRGTNCHVTIYSVCLACKFVCTHRYEQLWQTTLPYLA